MNTHELTLPVFPLPIFLLPGGAVRLRVFEPRYLKMVKIASQEKGFVVWLNENKTKPGHSSNPSNINSTCWGSWVDIVNFDLGDDGVLEIDVKCHRLVELTSFEKDNDNLIFSTVGELNHWTENGSRHGLIETVNLTKDTEISLENLSLSLTELINENDMLGSLYANDLIAFKQTKREQRDHIKVQNSYEHAQWVIARWLELLPVNLAIKQSFITENGFIEASQFVESILTRK